MHELHERARAVVSEARVALQPTAADRARVRAALAARIGGGPSVAPPASAPVPSSLWTSLGAGVGVLAIVAALRAPAPVISVARGGLARAVPTIVIDDEPKDPRARSVDVRADAPAPGAPAAEPREDRAVVTPSRSSKTAEPRVAPAPESSLAAEVALLREASLALAAHDGRGSLAKLDELGSRYRNGVLSEERLAARVLALCAVGDRAGARAEAERFLRAAPRSPQSDRVRASCAFAGAATESARAGHPSSEDGGSR